MNWKDIGIFCLILFFALFLRVYNLGSVPPSLDWDEVATGWNAYGIWDVRLDEYGTRLPLSFRSFGDYKAPLLIYLTAPFVGLLGLEPWAVRLPSALFGTATVGILFFLVMELSRYLKWKEVPGKTLGYVSMFLLAVSPWHLLFSRPSFEPGLALFLIVAGTWLFLLGLRKPLVWPLAGTAFVLALYAYHSPKLFLPIFLPALVIIFRKFIFYKSWMVLISIVATVVIGLGLAYPLAMESLHGKAASRIATSIFYDEDELAKPLSRELISDLGSNYMAHLNPSFYLFGREDNWRISLKNYGLIPIIQWLFLLVGIFFVAKRWRNEGAQLLIVWFLLGFVPAMIGKEVPHSLRSLNVLPAVIVLSTYGFMYAVRVITEKLPKWRIVLISCVLLIFLLDMGRYFNEYYRAYPVYAASNWQYGYKEAAILARKYEDSVDKVIITSAYGQPYIFTYFFQKRQPMEVLWGGMIKYLFRDISWDSDKYQSNHLLIGTAGEIPAGFPDNEGTLLDEVHFPDGSVAFRIVRTVKRD